MLGWFSAATARTSRSKRSVNCAAETLMATSRPTRGSRARYTSPMPPAPSRPRTSYGPSFVPFARGISGQILLRKAVEKHGGQVALPGIRQNHDESFALHLWLAGDPHRRRDGRSAGD